MKTVKFAGICLCILLSIQITNAQDNLDLNNYLLKAGYTKLELKKMPTGHLHISGILNGVEGNFILDTGATGTVIEIKNEKKFKMQSESSERQAAGAGGTRMQMKSSSHNMLELSGFQLKNIDLMLLNLDHVNNAFESLGVPKVDGIIGADILTNTKAIIDYVDLSVYFKN